MDIEGIAGTVFAIVGILILIANIFVIKDHFLFMFIFIIISAGMILSSIGKVLDKLSDIEEKIKKLLYEEEKEK